MSDQTTRLGPGYRRRILIEPQNGCSVAELEDDYHRMVVSLYHTDGVVTDVTSEMKRSPWTGCPGAMQRLRETFLGCRLTDCAGAGEKNRNCTHLHDLAVFAAVHAGDRAATAYEVHCGDVPEGSSESQRMVRLWRDGALVLEWSLTGLMVTGPAEVSGLELTELGAHIAAQDGKGAEAVRILRWAAMVAQGRAMVIPPHLAATAFPAGRCYNFDPSIAKSSFRREGADIDWSVLGADPLADRSEAFTAAPESQASACPDRLL
ncbi:hypothetical protein [Novosphingobium malaysiense]|uniref:hypothetical protein n=1 Tax=Novosphingobium malaysiense TaxID=1348853 RepID=UPI00068933E7|nr:hypothetical protein [Novosphingobium malaysiense]